ncbi:MAG: hypothetical protein COX62_08610 [Deltaproteobacteria bacterium CG_4_10_14_0_2_um_filter_43_8]|nr:MAG: hypothetical protein COV43_06220 [Deltaproteobacteria bacterium CG11_big_fil_rev_8_21_14_0_20_42_23]PJA18501.1 MAG: hypothetical protein COX62_08610 [Deltaproteobacteria bacterium CG_4_10_14_0_2_um_filter_43_8]PJC64427.1 MAG: hypothetical protein CO021_04295 [Deltaproteobacteria bacterium CG_4_9_14_0_2_um_filter_42_21]
MAYEYGIDKTDWCLDESVFDNLGYTLLWEISSGSKTTSYAAEDNKSKEKVTLTFFEVHKLFKRFQLSFLHEGLSSEEAVQKAKEAVTNYIKSYELLLGRVHQLEHENIAQLHSFCFREDMGLDKPFIISEYVPGSDFFTSTRGMNPIQMISLFVPILEGLDFIHQNNMLHLNLKPSKVRINREQKPPLVKLTDFGNAFLMEDQKTPLRGTAFYMAPEAIEEKREIINERTDLYSFAVLAYYCLTGKQAFPERAQIHTDRKALQEMIKHEGMPAPLLHHNKEIPQKLNDLILKLLSPNPEDREFFDAGEVLAYIYNAWPEASKEMPFEQTSTII